MNTRAASCGWACVMAVSLAWAGQCAGAPGAAAAQGPGSQGAAASSATLRRTNFVWLDLSACGGRPVQSLADWPACRAAILERLQSIMGPLPGPERRCPLEPRIEEEADAGAFVRRLVSYQVEPGQRLKAYLLVPKKVLSSGLRAPGVLALHQTHPLGPRVVVGLGRSPDDEYGVELAQRGYVVLAPPYPLLGDYQPDLQRLGYVSGTMKAIWDNSRGLDLLSSLPFVKTNGFGAIGHSLGGHNAVFTAVFEPRIQAVVSSCGLDSFLDYMDGDITGWTSARYMPRLRAYKDRLDQLPFDFPEILAALAPRACLVSAPKGDTNFKWRSAAAVVEAARSIYALHGVPDRLHIQHPDCGHRFPPEMRRKAYEVFDAVLGR